MYDKYLRSPQTRFPESDESLVFGWAFLQSNVGAIATIDGIGFVVMILAMVPAMVVTPTSEALIFLGWLAINVVVAMMSLTIVRRGLDYWDEEHGIAPKRPRSAAVKDAFEAARGRFWAWIGYNLAMGLVVILITIPLQAAAARNGATGSVALLGLLTFGVLIFGGTYFVFVLTLCADGEREVFSASWRLVQIDYSRVLGTSIRLLLIAVIMYIPVYVLMAVLSWFALPALFAYTVLVQSIGAGAIVNMYRSVVQPRKS